MIIPSSGLGTISDVGPRYRQDRADIAERSGDRRGTTYCVPLGSVQLESDLVPERSGAVSQRSSAVGLGSGWMCRGGSWFLENCPPRSKAPDRSDLRRRQLGDLSPRRRTHGARYGSGIYLD